MFHTQRRAFHLALLGVSIFAARGVGVRVGGGGAMIEHPAVPIGKSRTSGMARVDGFTRRSPCGKSYNYNCNNNMGLSWRQDFLLFLKSRYNYVTFCRKSGVECGHKLPERRPGE
jgi:hypothetical protein